MLIVLNQSSEKKIIESLILKKNRIAYVQYIFLVGNKSILIRFALAKRIQIIIVYNCFF
jgi:hypothetical protein